METYILGNVRRFTMRLAERKGEEGWSVPQNIANWANYLTFDMMGDLCFGKAFEMLEKEDNRHVIDLIGNAAHMHLIVSRVSAFTRCSVP